jgi:hypothetical protein
VVKSLWVLFLAVPLSAQMGVLRLRVLEGDGGVHAAGSRSATLITIQVTDEIGKPVEGAAVSVQLPEDGPGGTFASGLRTEVGITDGRGQAAVRGLRVNRIPGPFEIRITAAKAQARAGMISRQYVAGGEAKARGSKRKWIVLATLVAGAAAGGLSARGGGSSTPNAPGAPPSLSIGTPTITLRRP